MKTFNKFLYLFVILLVFSSCTSKSEEAKDPIVETYTISDYYPFHENTLMIYEGEGNEYASQEQFFDYIRGNQAQLRTINGGTTMLRLLETVGGELRSIHSEGEFYHVEDRLGQLHPTDATSGPISEEALKNLPQTPVDVLLKEPLEVGTTWQSAYGHERSITALDKTIQVPYGEFQALEVTTLLDEGSKQYDYYVKDLGFVLSIYQAAEFEVKTLLSEVKKDYALPLFLRIYYPDFESESTAYSEETLEFHTNDSISELLGNKMKTVSGTDGMPTLTENVHLNSLQTDPNLGILYVDFSDNLVREMNAGSLLEGLILQSISNTLGNYTHLSKVVITLDGELYSSGHFMLEDGDYFDATFE